MARVETDIDRYRRTLPDSEFTGTMLEFLGIRLATSFFSALTLGIAHPWLVCWKEKWYADHTYIDGKQLRFEGSGSQLFVTWLLWLLPAFAIPLVGGLLGALLGEDVLGAMIILVVLAELYVFYRINWNLRKWLVQHSYFEGFRDVGSVYTGGMMETMAMEIVVPVLAALSLGIAIPWLECWERSWYGERTHISGQKLCFKGRGEDLFEKWIIWWLLGLVTFGIYTLLCTPIQLERWMVQRLSTGPASGGIVPPEKKWTCPNPSCGYQNSEDNRFCIKCGTKRGETPPEWKTCPVCKARYTGSSCPNPECGKRPLICRKCGRPVKDCICGSEIIYTEGRQQWCSRCRRWYKGSRCSWCDNIPRCRRCGKRPVTMEGEICDSCEKENGFFRPTDLD